MFFRIVFRFTENWSWINYSDISRHWWIPRQTSGSRSVSAVPGWLWGLLWRNWLWHLRWHDLCWSRQRYLHWCLLCKPLILKLISIPIRTHHNVYLCLCQVLMSLPSILGNGTLVYIFVKNNFLNSSYLGWQWWSIRVQGECWCCMDSDWCNLMGLPTMWCWLLPIRLLQDRLLQRLDLGELRRMHLNYATVPHHEFK